MSIKIKSSHHQQGKNLTPAQRPQILPDTCDIVKGLIVSSGLRMGRLAKAAKISQATLSHHLSGKRRNRIAQLQIHDAYCRLTGKNVTLDQFWGEFLDKRIAG